MREHWPWTEREQTRRLNADRFKDFNQIDQFEGKVPIAGIGRCQRQHVFQ